MATYSSSSSLSKSRYQSTSPSAPKQYVDTAKKKEYTQEEKEKIIKDIQQKQVNLAIKNVQSGTFAKGGSSKSSSSSSQKPSVSQTQPEQTEQVNLSPASSPGIKSAKAFSSLVSKEQQQTPAYGSVSAKTLVEQERAPQRFTPSPGGTTYDQFISLKPTQPVPMGKMYTDQGFNQPFLSVGGQKERLSRAGQSIELAGRQFLNLVTPGQQFTAKVERPTPKEQFTQFITSPVVTLGAPSLVASATVAGAAATTKFVVAQGVMATVPTVSRKIGEVTLPEQDKLVFQQIKKQGIPNIVQQRFERQLFEETSSNIFGKQFSARSAIEEIAPVSRFQPTRRGQYEDILREELEQRGYTKSQIESAVRSSRRVQDFGAAGEIGAVVGVSANIEKAFGTVMSKTLPKTTSTVGKFAVAGVVTGGAGTVEGSLQQFAQQTGRGEKVDVKDIQRAAAAGGVSAGVLGGVLGASTKGASTFLTQTSANILDPSEPIGDFVSALSGKIAKTSAKVPVVSIAPTTGVSTTTFVQTETTVGSETVSGKRRRPTTPSFVPSQTLTQDGRGRVKALIEPVEPQITIPSEPKTSRKSFVPTEIPTEVPTEIPTETTSEVPVWISTNVPTNVQTQIPVNTFVQTNVPTDVFTDVFTPQNLGLPLPFFPGSGGGDAFKNIKLYKASRPSKYVSDVASSLLNIKGTAAKGSVFTGLGLRPLATAGTNGRRTRKYK